MKPKCYFITAHDGNRSWSVYHLTDIDWNRDSNAIISAQFIKSEPTDVLLFDCECYAKRMAEILKGYGLISDEFTTSVQGRYINEEDIDPNKLYTFNDTYIGKDGLIYFKPKN